MGGDASGELGRCLVVGASGLLGRHLAAELLRRGHDVRGFDRLGLPEPPPGLEMVPGDVRRPEDLRAACRGVDTVFHTAAVFVFAGLARPAERRLAYDVNVAGVENALGAAREAGVRRFVYTSSNNVTFGDDPVVDGDESRPYAPRPRDLYTETKIAAERLVLAANGEGGLLTCAIRPGGIYGPGDPLILGRVVRELARGRFVVTIGDGSARSDNTFVENLVDGHLAAARHLHEGGPAPGRAYFVTDGAPVNYFEFFRPVVEGLGFPFPRRRLPVWPLRALAFAGELLHRALGTPLPPLTRLEVRKIAVTHTNRIDRARRELGWEPPVPPEEAMARCLPWCRERLARERAARGARRRRRGAAADPPHAAPQTAAPARASTRLRSRISRS